MTSLPWCYFLLSLAFHGVCKNMDGLSSINFMLTVTLFFFYQGNHFFLIIVHIVSSCLTTARGTEKQSDFLVVF